MRHEPPNQPPEEKPSTPEPDEFADSETSLADEFPQPPENGEDEVAPSVEEADFDPPPEEALLEEASADEKLSEEEEAWAENAPDETPDAPDEEPDAPDEEPEEEVPNWLKRIRARRAIDEEREAVDRRSSPPPKPIPDWLRDVIAPSDEDESAAPSPPAQSPEEAPDWLQDVIEAQETPDREDEDSDPDSEAFSDAEDRPGQTDEPQETLRQRRIRRRRERQARTAQERASVSAIRSLIVVLAAAFLTATIFTFWTPADFLSQEVREGLSLAYYESNLENTSPTPVPTWEGFRRIGIVSGHRGPHPTTGRGDPGAVCPDGLTEAEVNFNVARLVVAELSGRGYTVELLDEWDPRLQDFEASVLVSIHADSCHEFELPGANGFKVAPPASRTAARPDDTRLRDCLVRHYGNATGLPQHPSLTRDMTEYHSFREISPLTPASIIELGFMFADRDLLENHPDVMAEGIVNGILCFLEDVPPTPLPELTPWPTAIATPTPLETPSPS